MGWNKFSFRELLVLSLRWHDLIHFIINNVLFDFTESKVSRINFPLIVSIFLFTCIKLPMRSKIKFPYILILKHIDSWVNGLFGSINIFFSRKSIFKLLILCFLRKIIVSTNRLTQWLTPLIKSVLFERFVFWWLIEIVEEFTSTLQLSSFQDILCPFRFLCWDTVSKVFLRDGIIIMSVMFLNVK